MGENYRPKTKQQEHFCSKHEASQQGRSEDEPKTKQQIKTEIIDEISRLGEKFIIFRDYDYEENARRAIVEYNYKSKKGKITDEEIDYVLTKINVRVPPDGTEQLKVRNNKTSRRHGLSRLLGHKGFEVVSRDSTVLGTMIGLAKNVLEYA